MMNRPNSPASPVSSAARSFDESGDSEDLQALFDSIAAGSNEPPVPAQPALAGVATAPGAAAVDASGDSAELQALFDSVIEQVAQTSETADSVDSVDSMTSAVSANSDGAADVGAADAGKADAGAQVYQRIGRMARELHNTMRELGYDKVIEDVAREIPDTRQRLAYIVQMTEQAASKVLNAVDVARPIQDGLHDQSAALSARWDQVFANQLSAAEFKLLAAETHQFLQAMPQQVTATNAQLTDIMMAQDFQDLTGQVVKKIVDLVQTMERQLLAVLMESIPAEVRIDKKTASGLLNGPVINPEELDVVQSQEQVDDLLESLGF